jgi:hypothetical protein
MTFSLKVMVIALAVVSVPAFVIAQNTTKLQQLKAQGASAPMLKTLEEDNKRLATSFKDLLVKEGYTPQAGDCKTTCSVSCTWVNGVCQPTTTCSVTCGF